MCAAIDAPPDVVADAAEADTFSSEVSKPWSPRLSIDVPTVGSGDPFTNSERRVCSTPVSRACLSSRRAPSYEEWLRTWRGRIMTSRFSHNKRRNS